MLPSITKAAYAIAAAVTVIVIAGQWCRRKARIGMQTYGFQIELANRFSMGATACPVTSIAPARRSVSLCRSHAVPGQAGALDGLLPQSRGLGRLVNLTDVGRSLGLTLRHHHAEEVGAVVVLQHPRAVKP